jgi:16S rRNA G966 N2-methylase RsmD
VTPALSALPDTITAPRTDAVYNCHAYLTKVPLAAIRPFIEVFTQPGDVVVDPFAGSGMTGIAAAMLGRSACLSDISALGQHIATGYLTDVPTARFRTIADQVMNEARTALGALYHTHRQSDGASVEIVRTVWSFTYACPSCRGELVYYDHMQRKRTAGPNKCPACAAPFSKRSWSERTDVPVEVVVRNPAGRLVEQPPTNTDRTAIAAATADRRLREVPSLQIEDTREMFSRSGLGKRGLTETSRFFSGRNAIALLELWRSIQRVDDPNLRQKLAFSFTAILPRASRRYQWSAQRPLNAQNQTYYIAPVYYEWNVFELFERKIEAAIRASSEVFKSGTLFERSLGQWTSYTLASADDLGHLHDNAVDYIFTDPPFGSNIFYSDMNLFHEAWLGRVTDHDREAVMHTTGKKKAGTADRYETLLRGAFVEAFRVLKPGRYISVVFGNSNGRIWGLVQRALRAAGFEEAPVHVAILDKGQRSVKGLNSGTEGVATVDLVMTLQKPPPGTSSQRATEPSQADPLSLINRVVASLPRDRAQSPSQVYAAILRDAIQQRQAVDKLHLGDVLIALRNAGYTHNQQTGLLSRVPHAVAA